MTAEDLSAESEKPSKKAKKRQAKKAAAAAAAAAAAVAAVSAAPAAAPAVLEGRHQQLLQDRIGILMRRVRGGEGLFL